jgi:hypothetical protein
MLFILYPILVIVTIIVIMVDKDRESAPRDDFSGGNLFYRYGKKIVNTTVTIGVDGSNHKPLITIADGLINFITVEIKQQLASLSGRFQSDIVMITDRKMPSDQRRFIKTNVVTKRGSEITYFILVVGIGKQIVIHEYLYLKGKTKWTAVLAFVLTSPLHIWFWFYPWITSNYSVYANLRSHYNKSSYDFIDIITIIRGLTFLFSTKLKSFAKSEGLLTEDLNIVLNQNISNSQNININNSNRVNLNSITSTIKPG